MARTSSIYDPSYHLTATCDLDLQPATTNDSNGTTTLQVQHLCTIILKAVHKCRSYGLDKLNLWQFYHLTFKFDLDLQPTQTNVVHVTTSPHGEHLCKLILKAMKKYRSYGPDKLIYVTFKCDIDLQPP